MRRRAPGFTYVEAIAATALIGLTILSSAGLLLRWRVVSERLDRRAVAEHALSMEMDSVLAPRRRALPAGSGDWLSGADRECGLPEAVGRLEIEAFGGDRLQRVVLSLSWKGGRAVRETLLARPR